MQISVNRNSEDGVLAPEIGTGLIVDSTAMYEKLHSSSLEEIPGRGAADHGVFVFILSQDGEQMRLQQTTIFTYAELWFRHETVTLASEIDVRGEIERFEPSHQSFSVGPPTV